MMYLNYPQRSTQAEILDDFELKGNDLAENLAELEQVNRLLGGNALVREGVSRLAKGRQELRVVDIGCGAGDALRLLARWKPLKNCNWQLLGVDANANAVRYAREHSTDYPNIRIEQLNIISPEFKALEADIVMFNLFLHHFEEEEIVMILKHCHASGAAILINDLQRSRIAYHAFRLVSRILGFSFISRNDGKLSVKKSFTRRDWQRIMEKAGINDYRLHWRWAFRYLLLVDGKT